MYVMPSDNAMPSDNVMPSDNDILSYIYVIPSEARDLIQYGEKDF